MNDTFRRPEEDDQPPELGHFSRLLIKLAGADPDYVIRKCPQDIGNLKAAGSIAVGSFVFNSAAFTSVGSHLAGHFSLPVLAAGVGLAGYTLAADSYNYFRCEQIVSGVEQLAQAQLQVSLPRNVRRRIRRTLALRVTQSCFVSLIVGVMTSLIVYSDDIRTRIRLNELQNKAGVLQQIGEQASTDLKRANNAVNSTTNNIALLDRQINARLTRTPNAASGTQVQALQARKSADESRLVGQKAELSRLEERLHAGLDDGSSSSHAGILAQINALEQIAGDDWKIMFLIILVELIAMGFDLTPILAKMNWLPTQYAVLKAREYLEDMDRIVEEMVSVDHDAQSDSLPSDNELPANDNVVGEPETPANDNNVPETFARRGRGRPRIHPRPPANGSGNPSLPGT